MWLNFEQNWTFPFWWAMSSVALGWGLVWRKPYVVGLICLEVFIACALAAALSTSAISASESNLRDIMEREKSGLNNVSKPRLQEMVSGTNSRRSQPVATVPELSKSWVDAQPTPKGGPEWRCLAEALYFEARGETVKGQFAVAEVILNRVKSGRFPDTLCDVIHQGTGRKYQCQFTYTCDGHKEVIAEPEAFDRVAKVARVSIDGAGVNLTDGATHYHTVAVRPSWSKVYTKTARIGVHVFYRDNYRTASSE